MLKTTDERIKYLEEQLKKCDVENIRKLESKISSLEHMLTSFGHTSSLIEQQPVQMLIKKLHDDSKLPTRAYGNSSGWDLYAYDDGKKISDTKCMMTLKYRTGLAINLPEGYGFSARPRSSISTRTGLIMSNGPGTIEYDYTGEIFVTFRPAGSYQLVGGYYKKGDAIAQLVIEKIYPSEFKVIEELPESVRGSGGHGSSDEAKESSKSR